jgi:hypothetical protein
MFYTIDTLSAPAEHIEWKNIRYIGMSINIFSRYKRYLAPHEDTNPEKAAWIQDLLAHGQPPTLGVIEEVGTIEEARQREQYWIRFAIARGAELLNRAIWYTEEERAAMHRRRAIRYACVEKLLARGIDAFIQLYIPVFDHGQKHWDSLERMHSILFAWFYQSYPDLFTGTQEGA